MWMMTIAMISSTIYSAVQLSSLSSTCEQHLSSLHTLGVITVIVLAVQCFICLLVSGTVSVLIWMGRVNAHIPVYQNASITSQSHPLHVDMIEFPPCLFETQAETQAESHPHPYGRLGMCVLPGRRKGPYDRNLDEDLTRLRNQVKADVIVTLVQKHELEQMQLHSFEDSIRHHGMESVVFSIRDKFIPDDFDAFFQLVHDIVRRLEVGQTVIVHCNGGIGRTGLTVTSTIMVALGRTLSVSESDTVHRHRHHHHHHHTNTSTSNCHSVDSESCSHSTDVKVNNDNVPLSNHDKDTNGKCFIDEHVHIVRATPLCARGGVPTVSQAVALCRYARPRTLRNPLQLLYARHFRTLWMLFHRHRV
jgi:protein-tyrosine phosphatase